MRTWSGRYASTTLVVILTVLLPLLAIQLALVGCAFAEFPTQTPMISRRSLHVAASASGREPCML